MNLNDEIPLENNFDCYNVPDFHHIYIENKK